MQNKRVLLFFLFVICFCSLFLQSSFIIDSLKSRLTDADKGEYANIITKIAGEYLYMGDYDIALDYYHQSIELSQKYDDN